MNFIDPFEQVGKNTQPEKFSFNYCFTIGILIVSLPLDTFKI